MLILMRQHPEEGNESWLSRERVSAHGDLQFRLRRKPVTFARAEVTMCDVTRKVQVLQERILDASKMDGSTDHELAALMGCDRSMVSKIRGGEKNLNVGHLRGLLLGGADALRPLAELAGYDLVKRDGIESDDLQGESLELALEAGRLAYKVHVALADHNISKSEATELRAIMRELDAHIQKIRATVPKE